MVEFYIKDCEEPTLIHAAVLSAQSSDFRHMSSWKQWDAWRDVAITHGYGVEKDAILWSEVDKESFGCFIQFLYTSQYSEYPVDSDHEPQGHVRYATHASFHGQCLLRDGETVAEESRVRLSFLASRNYLRKHFYGDYFKDASDDSELLRQFMLESQGNYKDKMSRNMAMFVFGSGYGFHRLRGRATFYMQRTLFNMVCYDQRVEEVIDVILEFYEPPIRYGKYDPDEARTKSLMPFTLAHFAAFNAEEFSKNEKFDYLLDSHKSFRKLFYRAVEERNTAINRNEIEHPKAWIQGLEHLFGES